MHAINSKSSGRAHTTSPSPSSRTNHLSPRRVKFEQIASVTMVITGNSRLLMPNVLLPPPPPLHYPTQSIFSLQLFPVYIMASISRSSLPDDEGEEKLRAQFTCCERVRVAEGTQRHFQDVLA